MLYHKHIKPLEATQRFHDAIESGKGTWVNVIDRVSIAIQQELRTPR